MSAWERAPAAVKDAIRAAFPREQWEYAAAIAEEESAFDARAHADTKEGGVDPKFGAYSAEDSRGIFQVNVGVWGNDPFIRTLDLWNPADNARAAAYILGKQGWGAWKWSTQKLAEKKIHPPGEVIAAPPATGEGTVANEEHRATLERLWGRKIPDAQMSNPRVQEALRAIAAWSALPGFDAENPPQTIIAALTSILSGGGGTSDSGADAGGGGATGNAPDLQAEFDAVVGRLATLRAQLQRGDLTFVERAGLQDEFEDLTNYLAQLRLALGTAGGGQTPEEKAALEALTALRESQIETPEEKAAAAKLAEDRYNLDAQIARQNREAKVEELANQAAVNEINTLVNRNQNIQSQKERYRQLEQGGGRPMFFAPELVANYEGIRDKWAGRADERIFAPVPRIEGLDVPEVAAETPADDAPADDAPADDAPADAGAGDGEAPADAGAGAGTTPFLPGDVDPGGVGRVTNPPPQPAPVGGGTPTPFVPPEYDPGGVGRVTQTPQTPETPVPTFSWGPQGAGGPSFVGPSPPMSGYDSFFGIGSLNPPAPLPGTLGPPRGGLGAVPQQDRGAFRGAGNVGGYGVPDMGMPGREFTRFGHFDRSGIKVNENPILDFLGFRE